jgi:hypothetical protein
MVQDEQTKKDTDAEKDKKDREIAIIKQLSQVICICKGINLRKVLTQLSSCETLEDVNQKAGTGSGGCQGQRCGPKIRILLKKKQEKEKA